MSLKDQVELSKISFDRLSKSYHPSLFDLAPSISVADMEAASDIESQFEVVADETCNTNGTGNSFQIIVSIIFSYFK